MATISDKVALITGGGGGIGRAIAQELLANGAKGIAIVDISEDAGEKAVSELTATFGYKKAVFIKTDVTIKDELENAFKATIGTYNHLDILINSAGIINEFDWKKTISINFISIVESTYLAMQKYLLEHRSADESLIVNIASTLGLYSVQSAPMYCATKHALVGFGQSLGGDEFYKKYQVRVLTLCPGGVRTPLFETRNENLLFASRTPPPRYGLQEPERIGKAVIEVIAKGRSGSLWVIENDEPVYEVAIPDRKAMKV